MAPSSLSSYFARILDLPRLLRRDDGERVHHAGQRGSCDQRNSRSVGPLTGCGSHVRSTGLVDRSGTTDRCPEAAHGELDTPGFRGTASDRAHRQHERGGVFGIVEDLLVSEAETGCLRQRLTGPGIADEQGMGAARHLEADPVSSLEGIRRRPHGTYRERTVGGLGRVARP